MLNSNDFYKEWSSKCEELKEELKLASQDPLPSKFLTI
jgi:hypothetical protein